MCLITKMICPQRARKDIICYKIMRPVGETLITPYMEAELNMKERYDLSHIKSNDHNVNGLRYIKEGFFHAYINEKLAWMIVSWNEVIIQCRIPKGTLYYKSKDGKTICAKSIILENRIKHYHILDM